MGSPSSYCGYCLWWLEWHWDRWLKTRRLVSWRKSGTNISDLQRGWLFQKVRRTYYRSRVASARWSSFGRTGIMLNHRARNCWRIFKVHLPHSMEPGKARRWHCRSKIPTPWLLAVNSQSQWGLTHTLLWYPMRLVHSPSIPQNGIRTLKKLVNKNIVFVLNLKYRCIYQKPNVEVIEQAAWVMPRYVICKKENETESFWMMLTRVPIDPC